VSGPYRFSFEPFFLVLTLAAALLYIRDVRRTPATERPGGGRVVAFALGLALIAVPVDSPLETLSAHYLLLAHLLQNALIADWGPPLVIIGLTPAMRGRVAAAGGRPLELLTRPVVALSLWIVVWYGVHVSAFYDWALRDSWPLTLEHALLVAAGLVFWWPVLGEPRRLGALGILAYLGIAFITAPWLSLAYIFASSPFYAFYVEAPRLWGISPIRDQNLAGILMNAEQTSIIFVAFAWALLRVLAEEEENQRRLDAAYLEARQRH
jgi:cytochrome c oxidase assembly factor CtaG